MERTKKYAAILLCVLLNLSFLSVFPAPPKAGLVPPCVSRLGGGRVCRTVRAQKNQTNGQYIHTIPCLEFLG